MTEESYSVLQPPQSHNAGISQRLSPTAKRVTAVEERFLVNVREVLAEVE